MAVVKNISGRVAVIYLKHAVEMGTREQLFNIPRHDYTRHLLTDAPVLKSYAQLVKGMYNKTADYACGSICISELSLREGGGLFMLSQICIGHLT